MPLLFHSAAQRWKSSERAAPLGSLYDWPYPPPPLYIGARSVEYDVVVSLPSTSMMSPSPLYGHGRPVRKSAPIIQNAGQKPWPFGTLMRASTRPYWKLNLLPVFIRCEV